MGQLARAMAQLNQMMWQERWRELLRQYEKRQRNMKQAGGE